MSASRDSNRFESAIQALTYAEKRLKVLPILLEEKRYGEILRETKVIAELSLKGILNHAGVPHDGQPLISALESSIQRMPDLIQQNFPHIAKVSGTLKRRTAPPRNGRTRPTTRREAAEAITCGGFLVQMAQGVIKGTDD